MFPAIFLDRDGVIIENRDDYILSWNDVKIFPQAVSAIAKIKNVQYKIVIITNQSCVGRGLISLGSAVDINSQLVQIIKNAGGRIDGVFMCPHSPTDNCDCRKPKPGLLYDAAHSLNIDLSKSIMIGDALSDLLAGKTAGIKELILLRTGRGKQQEQLIEKAILNSCQVFNNLDEALPILMNR